jgi:hypothetical protein
MASINLSHKLIQLIENGQFASYDMHGLLLTYIPTVTPQGQHCLMITCLNQWPSEDELELVRSSLILAHRRHNTDICYNVSAPIEKTIRNIHGYAIYWQQWPLAAFFTAPAPVRKQITAAMAS